MLDYGSGEKLISLAEAAHGLPGKPNLSTLWRWIKHGVGRDRVKLETLIVGGRRYTSREAIRRFIAARNQQVVQKVAADRGVAGRDTLGELVAAGLLTITPVRGT